MGSEETNEKQADSRAKHSNNPNPVFAASIVKHGFCEHLPKCYLGHGASNVNFFRTQGDSCIFLLLRVQVHAGDLPSEFIAKLSFLRYRDARTSPKNLQDLYFLTNR